MGKKSKKVLLVSAVLAMMLGGSFCVGNSVEAAVNGFADGTLSYSNYNKLHDYLVELTLTDYNYGDYVKARKGSAYGIDGSAPACSAVCNNKYFGRNLDLTYDASVQAVTRVPAAKGRFASISVGYLRSDIKDFTQKLNALSYTVFDGINENGVAVNCNMYDQPNTETHGGYIKPEGTNPGKPTLSLPAVVRYVLDNAKSAEQIVNVLKNDVNIVCNDTAEFEELYGLHFMIADKKKHYIVEFVDNKVVVSDDTVMTNFFNTLHDKAIAEGHRDTDGNGIETFVKAGEDANYQQKYPMGVERYKILKQHYDEGKISMQKMAELMQRVKYSQVYRQDGSEESRKNYFYSEDATPAMGEAPERTIKQIYDDKVRHYDIMKAEHAAMWNGRTWKDLRSSEYGCWQTMNTSVYDLRKLKLLLYVQEEYDRPYKFSL